MTNITIMHGDCLTELATLPDDSVDSIVTDPPYGLANTSPEQFQAALTKWVGGERDYIPEGKGFLGKSWDAFVPPPAVWDECLRVLKPGGHIAVFSGARTQDLMGLSIRLAGFEIRDTLAWIYGSGFPKSMDISKAIDKAVGAEREVVGTSTGGIAGGTGEHAGEPGAYGFRKNFNLTTPASDAAKQWDGWGTALKPAIEPIILARKPFKGTVANNVLTHGVGGLNIDACRVGTDDNTQRVSNAGTSGDGLRRGKSYHINGGSSAGRFPANVLLDEHAAAEMDGGASRFFPVFKYQAKAPKRERQVIEREDGTKIQHPTVKPLELLRWLITLVTPEGGTVLDPFAGSGTTVEAAILDGFTVIGIERDADYLELIQVRIDRHPLAEAVE